MAPEARDSKMLRLAGTVLLCGCVVAASIGDAANDQPRVRIGDTSGEPAIGAQSFSFALQLAGDVALHGGRYTCRLGPDRQAGQEPPGRLWQGEASSQSGQLLLETTVSLLNTMVARQAARLAQLEASVASCTTTTSASSDHVLTLRLELAELKATVSSWSAGKDHELQQLRLQLPDRGKAEAADTGHAELMGSGAVEGRGHLQDETQKAPDTTAGNFTADTPASTSLDVKETPDVKSELFVSTTREAVTTLFVNTAGEAVTTLFVNTTGEAVTTLFVNTTGEAVTTLNATSLTGGSVQRQPQTLPLSTTLASPVRAARRPAVSFNARLSSDQLSTPPSTLVWDTVVVNAGQAYDPSTGRLTAPVTGRYYLAVTTVPLSGYRANVDVMVKGELLCRIHSEQQKDVGSCQGIRRMDKGDEAWVQPYKGLNSYKAVASSFTGFLLAGEDDTSRPSFSGRLVSDKSYRRAGETLVWDAASDNPGEALNMSTGVFTAPVPGEYFLAFSAASYRSSSFACASVTAGNVSVCYACACSGTPRNCQSTHACQGTVKMAAGQTAQVRSDSSDCHFLAEVTSFSGFLVNGDKDDPTSRVSFSANLTASRLHKAAGEVVVWDHSALDTQGAYDRRDGTFAAPTPGLYFFAVHSRSNTVTHKADADLVSSAGQLVCRVDSGSDQDQGACQGAVQLSEGERVWVRTRDCPCNYFYLRSGFTGFLIQPGAV